MVATDQGMKIDIPRASNVAPGGAATNPLTQTTETGKTGGGTNAPPINVGAGVKAFGGALKGLIGKINPFDYGLSSLSASDLAGLSPELMTTALELGLQKEQMSQRTITDLISSSLQSRNIDVMENYYQGLLQNQKAGNKVDLVNAATKLIDVMTDDKRTALQKDYEYAIGQGYEGSLPEFKVLSDDPNSVREYNYAKANGYAGTYTDFLAKYKKSEINIGPYESTIQRGKATAELDVTAPGFSGEVEKIINDPDNRKRPTLDEVRDYAKTKGINEGNARRKITRLKVLEEMDKRIRQAYKDSDIRYDSEGWYIGDKLIVRNPYGTE